MKDIFCGSISSTGGAGTGVWRIVFICRFSVGLSHVIGIWWTVGFLDSGLSLINWLIRWTCDSENEKSEDIYSHYEIFLKNHKSPCITIFLINIVDRDYNSSKSSVLTNFSPKTRRNDSSVVTAKTRESRIRCNSHRPHFDWNYINSFSQNWASSTFVSPRLETNLVTVNVRTGCRIKHIHLV